MKHAVIFGGVVLIALGIVFIVASYVWNTTTISNDPWHKDGLDNERIMNPDDTPSIPPVTTTETETFTGVLQAVNTGCFADGECFITVDGKHVTVLLGWNQDTVGSLEGAASIGDLETLLGSYVEVYAASNGDNRYSLYGREEFYVKVLYEAPADTEPVAAGSCVVAGCSSQLCVDESQSDIATDCMYREAYACYQTATCERQASGSCGWTETAELQACLVASE